MKKKETKIRRLRKLAGFDKAVDFARAVGIDPRSLSAIETGKIRLPRTATLLKIAAVLDTTVDRLLKD